VKIKRVRHGIRIVVKPNKIRSARRVKKMELTAPSNIVVLDGKRIEEFLERSKTGAMTKMMRKLEILEEKKKKKGSMVK
jgi:hypothetical protein